ncbi:MAG: siderophore-interacting protein [Cellulomonadaceae bacterium]
MARNQNIAATRIKPQDATLLTLQVLRTERISPGFVRVTLGGPEIAGFTPMGFDQWFRLFIPVDGGSLARLPAKLDTLSYLRYLTISKTQRPVLRNYTVRAFRPAGVHGPELDVDFVLHGSAEDGASGPAATWAQRCAEGDSVGVLDEGVTFAPPEASGTVAIVADETGLPAVAGILASLDADTRGTALVEVGHTEDRQELTAPPGIELSWVVRPPGTAPGATALAAVRASSVTPDYGWVVGESALATGVRRHWVGAGLSKTRVTFCGYWKAGRAH